MFKFGGGKMTTDKFFFQKFFRRGGNDKGGKMTEGITVILLYNKITIKELLAKGLCQIVIYQINWI